MNRRSFLTRSALVLPALLVGDEALEAFARLTHVRKSFPSAKIPRRYYAVRTGLPPVKWRALNEGVTPLAFKVEWREL